MNIGIIGAGAIAQFLIKTIHEQKNSSWQVTSILVRDREKYEHLTVTYGIKLHTNVDQFLAEPMDIVVEAATVEAVQHFLPIILPKKDVVIISIGAFVEEVFLAQMQNVAKENNRTIYLPSGAIGGLDLLQHANALEGIEEVLLTTRKPAHTLTSENLNAEKIIFSGTAREAIQQFPKNINVAIVLSLAGIGMDHTQVNIVADPKANKNTHQIEISGTFGKMSLSVTNDPLPDNPKTSYLAALSVFSTLKHLNQTIQIG